MEMNYIDVVSGVEDNGTEAYHWVKFHGSSSYSVCTMHFCYRQTATVFVAIGVRRFA